jgi:uncharacterized RDD family membrane protein YckC
MQVACPHCRQVLEFADRRPVFCGFCGGSLADASGRLATTQAYVEVASHEAPTQVYVDEDSGSRSTFATAGHPDSVGDYKLLRQLGQGGMGVVYEAEQAATGRRVALKLLSPKLAHTDESMERFVREGRLAAAFSHPRSTFVFGAGQHAGQPYITMELMPGRTLNDVCHDEGPLPVNRAVDYILDVIEGLEAAHAAGIIHRDVKPSNCFLDSDGRVKVGDFGLSKSLVSDADLTRTGAFLGTPLFAAPEQVRAGQIDKRTDIYSIGAALFYMIAGRGPFTGDPAAVIAQIASDPAPPLRSLAPAVPKDLDQIVARTLEKDPARRFENLALLRHALLPFATGGIVPAPIGRRLGAYFIDSLVTGVVCGILIFILLIIAAVKKHNLTEIEFLDRSGVHPSFQLPLMFGLLAIFALVVSYFAICESWTGKSLGKRLLGLRVVGLDGGRPGIGRAFLRATLVPGLMWLSGAVLVPYGIQSEFIDFEDYLDQDRMLIQQLLGPLTFVPMLACLVTMRARNGYAGLHDLASGTRVVQIRPATGGSRSGDVPMTVPCAIKIATGPFGPFHVMGSLGTNGNGEILQARDETLHRLVWIVVRPVSQTGENSRVHAARAGIARATRPRWLQGGLSGPSRWDAFEAVCGAPLKLVVSQSENVDWERGRFLLLDLAEELVAASADGTLPATLTLDQVWVDRDGRVKLLDAAIESPGASGRPVGSLAPSATFSPAGLMRAAARLFSSPQTLPSHAQAFLAELARRPDGNETLVWAAAQLRESMARAASLNWSDRLVAVGVSTGTEYSFYQIPLALVMLAMFTVPGITEPIRLGAIFLFALALPAIAGYWTRGGPVFRLLGIDVRRSDGQPAGRGRCAWRNLVAWMPVMVAFSLNLAVLPVLMKMKQADSATAPALAGKSDYAQLLVLPLVSLAASFAGLMNAAGACYAVARPQRGIQDLLAGTRLVPR